jgi:septal ring factor EnvC (AmiA/AmiB activator)
VILTFANRPARAGGPLKTTIQSVAVLPTAAHQIRADLTHHIDEPPSFDQMQAEVTRLELVIGQSGTTDDKLGQLLGQVKTTMNQFVLSSQIAEIKDALDKGENTNVNSK